MDILSRGAADVDWIKLSRPDVLQEELAAARPVRPVLLHGLGHDLGRLGHRPEVQDGYSWDTLNRQLAVAGSPHLSLHLDLRVEDWDEPVDLRVQSREQVRAMLERLIANAMAVRQRVSVPLLVENMPFYGDRGPLRLVTQPEVIWQVVEAAGVGLLIDIGHLRCSAYHLGVDARAYARALPLHAVREVHVNGPLLLPGEGLRDRHYPCRPEDYELLTWLLGRAQPAIVTLEYGGTGDRVENTERNDPQALAEQIGELRRLL